MWNGMVTVAGLCMCILYSCLCIACPLPTHKLSVVSFLLVATEWGKKLPVIVLLPMTVLVQNLTWRSQGLSSHHGYRLRHSHSHCHGTNQSTRWEPTALYPGLSPFYIHAKERLKYVLPAGPISTSKLIAPYTWCVVIPRFLQYKAK